jgi:hypothetical protein
VIHLWKTVDRDLQPTRSGLIRKRLLSRAMQDDPPQKLNSFSDLPSPSGAVLVASFWFSFRDQFRY